MRQLSQCAHDFAPCCAQPLRSSKVTNPEQLVHRRIHRRGRHRDRIRQFVDFFRDGSVLAIHELCVVFSDSNDSSRDSAAKMPPPGASPQRGPIGSEVSNVARPCDRVRSNGIVTVGKKFGSC
jgi:hypothetical protein